MSCRINESNPINGIESENIFIVSPEIIADQLVGKLSAIAINADVSREGVNEEAGITAIDGKQPGSPREQGIFPYKRAENDHTVFPKFYAEWKQGKAVAGDIF